MTLTTEQLNAVQDFAEHIDVDIRCNYSGRGMFGRNCIGFITDMQPFTLAMDMAEYAADDDDFPIAAFRNAGPSVDDMGMSGIIYFPSISIEDDVETLDGTD